MSPTLTAGFVWVIAASVTALLPMRRQMAPGLILLAAAPVLLVAIALNDGMWIAALGLLAFLSMFRRPLLHLLGRLRERGNAAE